MPGCSFPFEKQAPPILLSLTRSYRRLGIGPVGTGTDAPHGTTARGGRAARPLQEIDFRLLVNGEARQGALRFARARGRTVPEAGANQFPGGSYTR